MEHKVQLTSSEISSIWSSYLYNTMASCIMKHFEVTAEDERVKTIVTKAITITEERIALLQNLFTNENMIKPDGFTEKDVHLHAPRLYTDLFYIQYIYHSLKSGMMLQSSKLAQSTRKDVRDMFQLFLHKSVQLYQELVDLMLEMGIYNRTPSMNMPKEHSFIQSNDFFTKKRPLTAMELSELGLNIETNFIGKLLLMGFSQTTKTKKIKNFFHRGVKIAEDNIIQLTDVLIKNKTEVPSSGASIVTDSTEPAYSEKLMLFHVDTLNSIGMSNFSLSLASSTRNDLGVLFGKLIAVATKYSRDGADLLIEKGCYEEPPMTVNRDHLLK
ncbi:DUF3231 family protein [Bacillus alkalisoli]|uniref:DUF3231 family protein n=1 Tax=Bacillus alkalisoli TaxID=2011008 RepID=UPI0018E205E2|nr:DUF3231 family protein [Bacillus alkalisoli]